MSAKHWVGLLFIVAVGAWSRGARAANVITMNPDPVDAGSVRVGTPSTVFGSLTDSGADSVDLAIDGACTYAADFALGATTMTDLSISSTALPIQVTFTPSTDALENCNVFVYTTGTMIELGNFHVQGTGGDPMITVTPASPANFGSVRVAGGSSTVTIVVKNTSGDTGTAANLVIPVGGLTLGGVSPGDYSIMTAPTLPATIAPGGSANVVVKFDPTATGTRTAELDIASNDPTTATYKEGLTGDGTAALINVTDVSFGTLLGGATGTGSIMVQNTAMMGGTNLNVTAAAITQSSTWFSFTGAGGCAPGSTVCTFSPPTMIASGGMATVGVQCHPPANANTSQTATVTFTSDSDPGGNNVAMLSCTGSSPDITLTMPATTPVNFGTVEVRPANASAPATLQFTNTGTATLNITNVALPASPDFAVTNGPLGPQTTPVAAGATASWQVVCEPTTFGTRTGTFQVTSDAQNASTLNIGLTCVGNQAILAVSSPAFGGVNEGDTSNKTVTLTNNGNVPITNISYMFANAALGYSVTAPTFPIASLNPGTPINVTVQFAPVAGMDGGPDDLTFSGVWGTAPTAISQAAHCTGTGLKPGWDVSPATVDYGDMRWDATSPMTFTITLTGTSPTTFNEIDVASNAGTPAGEFHPPTLIKHGGTTVTLPFQLTTTSDTLVVTIPAGPATQLGPLAGTVTVRSDSAAIPTRSLQLTANAVAPELTLDPGATVPFGPVDIQGPAQHTTITITNGGDGPLNLGAVTAAGGSARITFPNGLPTAQVIPAGGMVAIAVTYAPTLVANDTTTLVAPLTGLFGAPQPMNQMIMITGRGITRAIQVGATPTFPDTFRNPGSDAPVLPLHVHNGGEATLSISTVMLSSSPVWTLADPAPVDIPGDGDHDFMIKFAPTMAGKAPDGQLTLVDNDTGTPMVVVDLKGNGLDRAVELGPLSINLGYTGVGIPVRLSDLAPDNLLNVTSLDGNDTFQIRAISLDGDDTSVFEVEDSSGNTPTNIALAPNMTDSFDVVFNPTAVGDYTATATLFLDQDPTGQAQVTIEGHAVYVEANGGGGCNAGNRGGGGGALVIVGAALLARRRRRRAAGVVIAAAAACVVGEVAHAEPSRNLDLTMFDPTPATTGTGFQLQAATTGSNGDLVANALVSYSSEPLVLATVQNNDTAIKNRTMLELGGAYAFLGRFEAGLRMPIYLQSGDDIDSSMMFGVPAASGAARGDLTLHGKAQLWHGPLGGDFAVAIGAALTLPTASSDEFAGVTNPTGRVLALAQLTPDVLAHRLSFAVNAGAVLRARSEFANIDQGSGLDWGVGASYRVLDPLTASAEMFGELVPSGELAADGSKRALDTIEYLVGVHYQLERRFNLGAAVGRGLDSGLGAPAFFGAVTLAFVPMARTQLPIGTVVHEPHDSDGDGIDDSVDKCPNEPEDKDGFQDQDGCPDLDNDNDGIPDAQDKCPNEPEDKDGFQDQDGCPDPDNDNDGIPDAKDKCPNDPEDKDGFQDQDGCPDPDNDNDGIPDTKDRCPNEPETINGYQDDDGCPDKGDPLVIVSEDRIELLEPIEFSGTKIKGSSFNLLGQVGAQLRAHKEIKRLRVTVHVQPTSNPTRDQEITDKRAQAVRDWLAQWGIDEKRIEPRGFGGTKPLVPADSKGAAAINERVELIVLVRE